MRHEHLPAHIVADHLEGLLGRREAARAERHLAGCPECSVLRTDLVGVRAALASSRTGPMPARVATRIDAALAEAAAEHVATDYPTVVRLGEAGRNHAAAEGAGAVSPAGRSARRRPGSAPSRRRWLPALGTAVATIAIVAGGAAVLTQFGTSDDTGGSGVAAREPATMTEGEAGAGQGASAPSATAGGPGPSSSYDTASGSGATLTGTVLRSGRAYTAYTLSEGVRELLVHAAPSTADGSGAEAMAAPPGGSDARLARLGSQPALAECIRAVAKADLSPMVVDLATYGGKPAAIIVLADPADATNALVYVVGADCGVGVSSAPIAVTTVRRPVTASPPVGTPPSGTATTPSPVPSP